MKLPALKFGAVHGFLDQIDRHPVNNYRLLDIFGLFLNNIYSGLLKIRTPKKTEFCVFAKQALSKKSGLLCSRQKGLILNIQTYDLTDMELFKISVAEAHFLYFLTLINGFSNVQYRPNPEAAQKSI